MKSIHIAPIICKIEQKMHADSKKAGLQVDAPGLGKKILDERDGMQAKIEQLHGRFQLLEEAEVSSHAILGVVKCQSQAVEPPGAHCSAGSVCRDVQQ